MYSMVDDTSPVTLMPSWHIVISVITVTFSMITGGSLVGLGLYDHVESNICFIIIVILFI